MKKKNWEVEVKIHAILALMIIISQKMIIIIVTAVETSILTILALAANGGQW
jgi:hypothetical protein